MELYNFFFFFFLLLDCNRSDTTLLCDFGGWAIENGAAILPWLPLELSHQLVRKPLSHGEVTCRCSYRQPELDREDVQASSATHKSE